MHNCFTDNVKLSFATQMGNRARIGDTRTPDARNLLQISGLRESALLSCRPFPGEAHRPIQASLGVGRLGVASAAFDRRHVARCKPRFFGSSRGRRLRTAHTRIGDLEAFLVEPITNLLKCILRQARRFREKGDGPARPGETQPQANHPWTSWERQI